MYNVVDFYSSLFLEHLKIWYFGCGKNSCLAVEAFKVVISVQSLLVHSLISPSILTLLVVDQRLRELCLRTPAGEIFSAAARKMSYFAVICWQSAIWRGGSSGNQSRVQCGKIGGIARIVGGNKKARSQVSKLGVTCPLFALLPNRNIPLWTDQTPMTTTLKI